MSQAFRKDDKAVKFLASYGVSVAQVQP
jgi:hypothetical protein